MSPRSILVVPNVVRIDQRLAEPRTSQALDALFVGSAYGPNIDGLRWLLTRVWPTVLKRLPGVRLTIAGRDLGHNNILSTSPSPRGVEFIGRVEELEHLYRSAKVVLVPLFYGSGVPNKFLEALATDSAIVMTPYVREALGHPRGLRSHEGVDAWVSAVVDVLTAPDRGRVEPTVRSALLAEHGPRGFDRAMRDVVDRVKNPLH